MTKKRSIPTRGILRKSHYNNRLQAILLNALVSHNDGENVALRIEMKLLDAGYAVIALIGVDRAAVVDDVILATAGVVNNRVVARTASDLIVLLQNHILANKRSEGRVRNSVGNLIVGACIFAKYTV